MSTNTISLRVYRDLTNRRVGEPDNGPLARDAHRRRAVALHEDLKGLDVKKWGQTDDANPHELVEVIVGVLALPAAKVALAPAVAFLGTVLAESGKAALGTIVTHFVTKGLERMRKPKKDYEDFTVIVGGRSIIVGQDSTLRIQLPNGKWVTLASDATEAQIRKVKPTD